jgi:hypothetical protein
VERFIHNKLEAFHIKGETFNIDVEEAILVVLSTINDLDLYQIKNKVERQLKIKQMHDSNNLIMNNQEGSKISTCDTSSQTYFDEQVPLSEPIIQRDETIINSFDAFIESHCIVRSDVEVSSKNIIGAFRIHTKNKKREVTTAFTNYLKTKFKADRLKVQNSDQVVMGFSGVMLKPIEYRKCLINTEHENFVFNNFQFTPDGTVLWSDIVTEFKDWKRLMKKDYLLQDEVLLKQYLKESPFLLFDTVWASSGGGQGYYGMKSKKEITQHKTSATACKVEKKDLNNVVLSGFETIAKAAIVEKISPATMSRFIKNKIIFEGDGGSYFYAKK